MSSGTSSAAAVSARAAYHVLVVMRPFTRPLRESARRRNDLGALFCPAPRRACISYPLKASVPEFACMMLSVDDGIADLRVSGAIDPDWASAFSEHVRELRERADLRVVKLSGDGRFFCPGGDLAWMRAQADPESALHRLATTLHDGVLGLAALDAPVVARVHGAAAGAGLSLVLGADFAIAGASATFTVAYTTVGLSPDGGASWLLPRIVGQRRATELILTNRRLGAEEAAQLGIVTSAVDDDALDAAVDALVAQLAAGPTAAYGATKRLLQRSSQRDFADQLNAEANSLSALAGSATGREGIAAFLDKREAVFPVS